MNTPKVRTKDLLTVADFNKEEILNLFEFAADQKSKTKKGEFSKHLEQKSLAMIFEKSSTRTRVSFETGMTQLGGHALFLSSNDIQLGRGETPADTAQVLSRYVDGIMIRTFSQKIVEDIATNATIPVINGLTDDYHPCQGLTDFFTIYERNKELDKIKLTYVGDGNNVAHSLMLTGAILGSDVTIACPTTHQPAKEVVNQSMELAAQSGSKIEITDNIDEAVKDTNYLYTDTWTSMGQESEKEERRRIFSKYKITLDLISKSAQGCKVLHCLPAYRGEEIDADVMDSSHSIIFDQAENRLHTQKAIMCALMGK